MEHNEYKIHKNIHLNEKKHEDIKQCIYQFILKLLKRKEIKFIKFNEFLPCFQKKCIQSN